MTLRTSSATRRRVVSRSSVVLTTSATSSRNGSTCAGVLSCGELGLTGIMIAAVQRHVGASYQKARNCCRGELGVLDYTDVRQVAVALRIVQSVPNHIGIGD